MENVTNGALHKLNGFSLYLSQNYMQMRLICLQMICHIIFIANLLYIMMFLCLQLDEATIQLQAGFNFLYAKSQLFFKLKNPIRHICK
ncbi:unnamed protein product [Blepharisma stoltei]|uniref:Uncharacterized protein n=1 Tax=Blepharisma stoltei TaxID=1481888 RepID=A0AAU9JN81_9CILI|nr:unnamed protein product [Blepharisma stoltei]